MLQVRVQQARLMKMLLVTDGRWIHQCRKLLRSLLSEMCWKLKKCARMWILYSVQLICPRMKLRRLKKPMQNVKHLLFPTTVPIDGHRMYRWSFRRSIRSILKLLRIRRNVLEQQEVLLPLNRTVPFRVMHLF